MAFRVPVGEGRVVLAAGRKRWVRLGRELGFGRGRGLLTAIGGGDGVAC